MLAQGGLFPGRTSAGPTVYSSRARSGRRLPGLRRSFSYSLNRCPLCHKTVCEGCSVRRGGCVFCGDLCAHAFFFGDSDDADSPEFQVEE